MLNAPFHEIQKQNNTVERVAKQEGIILREIRNSFRKKFSRMLYERNSNVNPTWNALENLSQHRNYVASTELKDDRMENIINGSR